MPRFLRSWTDAEVETVVKMWATGMRALLIGRMIGKTKNAVIGQAHRMGLPKRGKGSGAGAPRRPVVDRRLPTPEERAAKARERMARLQAREAYRAERRTRVDYSQIPPPDALMLSIMQLEARHCRFPIGHPKEAGFGFCGAPREGDKPYCPHHCRLAYQPPESSRRTNSNVRYLMSHA